MSRNFKRKPNYSKAPPETLKRMGVYVSQLKRSNWLLTGLNWFFNELPRIELVKLLAVPLVLAAAGSIVTAQIQRESKQNGLLQGYFDQLDKLTFERNLLAEDPDSGAVLLARGRTIAALRELDHERAMQLIAFLQGADLARFDNEGNKPVISFAGQKLDGLNLSTADLRKADFENADLSGSNLEFVDLREANLKNTNLFEANLQEAFLAEANLQEAYLIKANLKEAFLSEANFNRADLRGANLQGSLSSDVNLEHARLELADLQESTFWRANLRFVNLQNANLSNADLREADLESAYLGGANLENIYLLGTNLMAAGLDIEQLSSAKICRTQLPDYIALDPNRNCEDMGIDPDTGESIYFRDDIILLPNEK